MPSNIVMAEVKIIGFRPIMWNHFGVEALSKVRKEKNGTPGNDETEWERSVLITENRQLYLDNSYIFGCIRDGSKYTKKGRGTLQSVITATLLVLEDKILINRFMPDVMTTSDSNDVYIDVRTVRNPTTKGRNIRYRVCSRSEWKATFTIQWDITIISRQEMLAVIIDAGKFCGLGDARNIGFGRFEVEEFLITEVQKFA